MSTASDASMISSMFLSPARLSIFEMMSRRRAPAPEARTSPALGERECVVADAQPTPISMAVQILVGQRRKLDGGIDGDRPVRLHPTAVEDDGRGRSDCASMTSTTAASKSTDKVAGASTPKTDAGQSGTSLSSPHDVRCVDEITDPARSTTPGAIFPHRTCAPCVSRQIGSRSNGGSARRSPPPLRAACARG